MNKRVQTLRVSEKQSEGSNERDLHLLSGESEEWEDEQELGRYTCQQATVTEAWA